MLCQPTKDYEYLGNVVSVERAPEVYVVEFDNDFQIFLDAEGRTAEGVHVVKEVRDNTSVHEDDQCVIAVTEHPDTTIMSVHLKGTEDIYTMAFTDGARDFFREVFSGS